MLLTLCPLRCKTAYCWTCVHTVEAYAIYLAASGLVCVRVQVFVFVTGHDVVTVHDVRRQYVVSSSPLSGSDYCNQGWILALSRPASLPDLLNGAWDATHRCVCSQPHDAMIVVLHCGAPSCIQSVACTAQVLNTALHGDAGSIIVTMALHSAAAFGVGHLVLCLMFVPGSVGVGTLCNRDSMRANVRVTVV
jgi:hypothetical protein